MSAPQILRAQFPDLFTEDALPALEELFLSTYNQHPMVRDQIFKKEMTQKDIWQYSEIHDMPLFSETPEGTEYTFGRPKQGYDKTLKPVKFGSGFSISEETVDDGNISYVGDMVRKLARSARESKEVTGMNVINNGFSTETTADGVALFSNSHTLPSGGTYDNLAAAADISDTALRNMRSQFETEWTGDTGIKELIQPRVVLVHSDNRLLANELLDSQLRVNDVSSDNGPTNSMNGLSREGLMVISSPHITDTNSYYMIAAPDETGLRIISRSELETKAAGPDAGFMTDSILYKARYREKVGAVHAKGIIGSAGGS